MALGNSDIVVAIMEIDFCENHGSAKAVEEVIDEGDGVAAFLHDAVECVVIDAQMEPSVFLLCEENQCSCRRG